MVEADLVWMAPPNSDRTFWTLLPVSLHCKGEGKNEVQCQNGVQRLRSPDLPLHKTHNSTYRTFSTWMPMISCTIVGMGGW